MVNRLPVMVKASLRVVKSLFEIWLWLLYLTLTLSAVSLQIADYGISPLDNDGARHVTSAVSQNTKDTARFT
jgi:hypothetical protein